MKKITLDYKYSAQSKVYFVGTADAASYIECSTCLGEGSIMRKDKSNIKCPTCGGKKTVSVGGTIIHIVGSGTVNLVNVQLDRNNDVTTMYGLDNISFYSKSDFFEFELYSTEADAQKECDKLNDKYTMGYTKI